MSCVRTTTIGIASSAISIRIPWKKSVQQTALNPPRKVYPMMISAQSIIPTLSETPGKIILNTDAPATNAEATYTVKQTKKIIAQITCSVLDFVAKRFERYCGTVIASPAALENFLSLVAQKIQFAAVPSTRPIPIHIWPKPNAMMEPGSPIKSHADISDACADIAVTQGPIERPPKK